MRIPEQQQQQLHRRGGPATATSNKPGGAASRSLPGQAATSTANSNAATGGGGGNSGGAVASPNGTGIPVAIPEPIVSTAGTIKVIRTLPPSPTTNLQQPASPQRSIMPTGSGNGVANQTANTTLPTATIIFIVLGAILGSLVLLVCAVKVRQLVAARYRKYGGGGRGNGDARNYHRAENLHNRNSSSASCDYGSLRNLTVKGGLGGSVNPGNGCDGDGFSFVSRDSRSRKSMVVPRLGDEEGGDGHHFPSHYFGQQQQQQQVEDRPYDTISIESSVKQQFSPPPAALPSHIALHHARQPRLSEGSLQDLYTLPREPPKVLQRDGTIGVTPVGAAVAAEAAGPGQEMHRESRQRFPLHVPSAETVAHAFLMLNDETCGATSANSSGGAGARTTSMSESVSGMKEREVEELHRQHLVVLTSPYSRSRTSASWKSPVMAMVAEEDGSGISSDGGYASPPSVASSGLVARNELMDMYAGRGSSRISCERVAPKWSDVAHANVAVVNGGGLAGEKVVL
ncbi:hypothetical protein BDR26DRAFT_871612 [Obelidium mucronatum]|nr:hypothetical protein BDR26DRAFT_871612 [Obelidium mucronatum]